MALRLDLEGFKIYDVLTEHVLPSTGVSLLQGASGQGKSTLFVAVAWALYGRERDPYSWNGKKKVCRVRVGLPDGVHVFRQKNPERLEVTVPDGRMLTSKDEAQDYLQKRYGTYDAWLAGAYLRQDRHNPLMEGNGGAIVAMLETLAFQDDPPKRYLDEANRRRLESKRALDRAQAVATAITDPVPTQPLDALTHPATPEHYTAAHAKAVKQKLQTLRQSVQMQAERTLAAEEATRTRAEIDLLAPQVWPTDRLDAYRVLVPALAEYARAVEAYEALPALPPGLDDADADALGAVIPLLQHTKHVEELCALYHVDQTRTAFRERIQALEEALANHDTAKEYYAHLKAPKTTTTPLDPSLPAYTTAQMDAARAQAQAYATRAQSALTLEEATRLVGMRTYVPRWQALVAAGVAFEDHTANPPPGVEDAQYADKVKELEQLRAGLESHACPSCKAPLRFRAGTLEPAKACPSTRKDFEAVERQVAWLATTERLDNDLARAEAMMEDCPYTEDDLEAWTPGRCAAAQKVLDTPAVEAPVPSAEAMEQHTLWVRWQQAQDRHEAWWAALSATTRSLLNAPKPALVKQLSDLSQALAQWPKASAPVDAAVLPEVERHVAALRRIHALEARLPDDLPEDTSALAEDVKAQDDLRGRLQAARGRMAALEARLATLPVAADADVAALEAYAEELTWVPRLLEDRVRYTSAQAELATCATQHALEVQMVEAIKAMEHRVLGGYLETFNATLAEVLEAIFTDPITARLELFTEDKPNAVWRIAYKGGKDTTLSELSGGEQARVSFAVTLALATASPFPMLFLDECFGSLDEDTRTLCLDAMRSVLHKPALVIAHGETEGFYDNVVTF